MDGLSGPISARNSEEDVSVRKAAPVTPIKAGLLSRTFHAVGSIFTTPRSPAKVSPLAAKQIQSLDLSKVRARSSPGTTSLEVSDLDDASTIRDEIQSARSLDEDPDSVDTDHVNVLFSDSFSLDDPKAAEASPSRASVKPPSPPPLVAESELSLSEEFRTETRAFMDTLEHPDPNMEAAVKALSQAKTPQEKEAARTSFTIAYTTYIDKLLFSSINALNLTTKKIQRMPPQEMIMKTIDKIVKGEPVSFRNEEEASAVFMVSVAIATSRLAMDMESIFLSPDARASILRSSNPAPYGLIADSKNLMAACGSLITYIKTGEEAASFCLGLIERVSQPEFMYSMSLLIALSEKKTEIVERLLFAKDFDRGFYRKFETRSQLALGIKMAAHLNDPKTVLMILSRVPAASRDLLFSMALYDACITGNDAVIHELLKQRVPLGIHDQALTNVMEIATEKGTAETVHSKLTS